MTSKIIFSYLSNRTEHTKFKNIFRKRSNILHDVTQGVIFGQLQFNINLIDLFYECDESDTGSYADDTTPCSWRTDT